MLQRWGILALVWACAVGLASVARAQEEALCAEVRIEILQELTMERQGFEAIMRITNSLDTYSIEDINISVNFTDAEGNAVSATSDTSASDAAFFIRVDDTQNVSAVAAGDKGSVTNGAISAGKVGEFRWLIVPTGNAAGQSESGRLYFVGATLSYAYGGKSETVEVAPDSIVVKPQPLLTLDYFLTREVIGDDAFTPEIEPPEPYTLGVRLDNRGYGQARSVRIESAQPKIVDNEQGLAINFSITGGFVENQPVAPSLLINFGEVQAQGMKAGRWIMESTQSGKFTSFSASFTHASELGGELTSLIEATNAHFLVKDVLVDLPGRDAVLDFLAHGPDGLYVYESENTGADLALCKSCASVAALSYALGAGSGDVRSLSGGAEDGFGFIEVADPYQGAKVLHKVVRGDGKQLKAANFWLSKQRAANNRDFDYFIHLFDHNATGAYTLYFVDAVELPQPPVIQAIMDRVGHEGGQIGFLVQSSDPNGTIPALAAPLLPAGAAFTDSGDGTGVFRWQPAVGQAGSYKVRFTASDGQFTTERNVNIKVNPFDDIDGDGLKDAWELEHFGNLDRDGTGDFDGDGRTDKEEHDAGTDPTVPEVAPGTPQIAAPLYDQDILHGAAELLPQLSVSNGEHPPCLQLAYEFEVYADQSMLQLVARAQVPEASGETRWTVAEEDLEPGREFADNSLYYWRARAITLVDPDSGQVPVASLWVSSRFFINTVNDAPSAPPLVAPPINGIVADTRPELVVNHAFDPDRDPLSYGFVLFHESDLEAPIAQVSGLLPGGNFQTRWRVPNPLEEDNAYLWHAWAEDVHGARTESEIGSFLVSLVNHPPTEPGILAPAEWVFSWLPDNGVALRVSNARDPEQQPLHYFFEVDTRPGFDSGAVFASGPVPEGETETAWTVAGLQEDTLYHWRVKASDGEMESGWVSASFSVNTENAPPPEPSLQNPGDGAVEETLRPLFEVNPVLDPDGDPVQYRFEIYADAALSQLVASQLQAQTQWVPEFELDDGSHYYWRARAEDDKGAASDWSQANRFAINQSMVNIPPQISLVLPDRDLIVSGPQLLIQWVDSDPDSSATIALYYRHQGSRVLIVDGIPEDEDGDGDQYWWDVSGLAPGEYTIEAEIRDEEHTVVATGCCTITVLEQSQRISVTPLTALETDEAGTLLAALEVRLNQPLQEGSSLTLSLQVSNPGEARLLGDNYLHFTADSWDEPQQVRLIGVDDCAVDGDRPFQLIFQPAESSDPAYQGLLLESIGFVNRDNEAADQKLFICRYTLEAQQQLPATGEVESRYRVHMQNRGVSLLGAAAELALLPSPEPGYSATLAGGNRFTFEAIALDGEVAASELLVIRHPGGQPVDFAKFSWTFEPGEPAVTLAGGKGNDVLYGSDNGDIIDGGAGNDTIYGGDGDDIIIGGPGADTLYGGAGDDTFIVEGNDPHADIFYGGDGYDRILGGPGDDAIRIRQFSGEATVELIDGGPGYNVIYGTNGNNVLDFSNTELRNIAAIDGLGGNDTIYGSQGDDVIIASQGSNKLYGNAGDDIFIIEGNNPNHANYVEGGPGFDQVIGGPGDDWFRFRTFGGDARVERIDGRGGVNVVAGTKGNNMLDFRGVELVNIAYLAPGTGNDTLYGTDGDDLVMVGPGNDTFYGEGGDDTFQLTIGDTGFNRYNGGPGFDRILGTPTDDVIGLRTFTGDYTVELIDGVGGYNVIRGTAGNNVLDFSNTQLVSIDKIDAGPGNDTVRGSQSADVIEGGLGSDTLYGNGGNDIFLITPGDTGFDTYYGGPGINRILGTEGDDEIRLKTFAGEARVQIIDGGAGFNRILGSAGNNVLDFRDTQLINIAEIDGGAGNDVIHGTDGDDVIVGGPGSDVLYGYGGDDSFLHTHGDTGFDTYYGGDGYNRLLGTENDDEIRLKVFSGEARVQLIDGRGGYNKILGSNGNNTLDFRNTELRNIHLIDGGAGNDTIYGSAANDVIRGGTGRDTLLGMGGADTYVFARGDGSDVIRDSGFSDGDKLLFEGDITPEDLWLVKKGEHLDIYVLGGADKVQVQYWQSAEHAIEVIETESGARLTLQKISDLADVMTAIGVPQSGAINLTGEQQVQVSDARAAAWQ